MRRRAFIFHRRDAESAKKKHKRGFFCASAVRALPALGELFLLDELDGTGEEAAEGVGLDVPEADEHGGIADVVVGEVVDVGASCRSSSRRSKSVRTTSVPGSAERWEAMQANIFFPIFRAG